MDPWLWLIVVLIIVACNAFFVAAEFALVKVRVSQLEIDIRNGKRGAKLVRHILEHLNYYLSGIQLGITLTSLLLGWVGEPAIAHGLEKFLLNLSLEVPDTIIHTLSFGIALFTISLFHIVLWEQIPKLIAIKNPVKISYIIARPLRVFQLVWYPFIWVFDTLTKSIMTLFRLDSSSLHDLHSEEEIKLLLTESEEGGVIGEASNELIQNVFEFDDRTVRQIYVPRSRMFALDIDEDFETHFDIIVREGYSRIPVYRDTLDNIVWVVYLKDFLPVIKEHGTVNLHKLVRPAHFAPQNQKIEQLLKDFQRLHIQMAIVTNEHGETAGIVTLEDIVEELVGEIQDEHDSEEALVIEKRPGTYIVRTESSITDVNDYLPHPLPESPEYDTISGFTNAIFGHIPHAGESIEYAEYDVTVLRRGKNAVELIKIQVQK
jgi:CBS domain containing-hemolysin-like protein